MKTIKPADVTLVNAEKVTPGMIIAEGVVIQTEVQKTRGRARDVVFLYTAADHHISYTHVGASVQVYGRLTESMTAAVVDATSAA